MNRRTQFKICLAACNMTQADFARRLGVSKVSITTVLKNSRTSKKISDAIDSFIALHSKRASSFTKVAA